MARACLICGKSAVPGRSRCAKHGPASVRERNPAYGAEHQRFAAITIKRANGRCAWPGGCTYEVGPSNPLQADHVIPLSEGGRIELSNYQALCRTHNIAKGGRNRRSQ